jgi:serine/threonine protein kinase
VDSWYTLVNTRVLAGGSSGEVTTRSHLPAGAQIGERYRITSVLGVGGMGVVYAAYDPELDRPVAIKILQPEVGHDRDMLRARLMREARAMARLAHPNVAAVYDVGSVGDDLFVAMELIEGRTLRAWVAQDEPGWEAIVNAYRQAGQALAAAHALGIIHRDFKPDNALIDEHGRVRVVDFGLARANSDNHDSHDRPLRATLEAEPAADNQMKLTRTGSVIGTPAYMAPEQHLGQRAGAAADQFSFCVSLYEALWTERPFAGDTAAEVSRAVIDGNVREPPRNADVPLWIYGVLAGGLRPSAHERYPSMEAILTALRRDPRRTPSRWWVGAATLALIATIAAGLVATSSKRPAVAAAVAAPVVVDVAAKPAPTAPAPPGPSLSPAPPASPPKIRKQSSKKKSSISSRKTMPDVEPTTKAHQSSRTPLGANRAPIIE